MTSPTHLREPLFRKEIPALLFLVILYENRKQGRFLLHEFVAMPDHFHLMLTPAPEVLLEKALQYIKGGFSFRANKEAGIRILNWQESFTKHRICDYDDYQTHRTYIHQNPVEAGLVPKPEEYAYSSAHPCFELDPRPPWLKPAI